MKIRVEAREMIYNVHWRVAMVGGRARVMIGLKVEDYEDVTKILLYEELCDAAARAFGCVVDVAGYILNWDEMKPKLEELMRERKKRAWDLVQEAMHNVSVSASATSVPEFGHSTSTGYNRDVVAG